MFQILLDPSSGSPAPVSSDSSVAGPLAFFVLGIIAICVLGILLHRLTRRLRRPELFGTNRERIRATWEQIERSADQGTMGAKLAVIEADKLLDTALRSLSIPGETLGERLKYAAHTYPKIRNVWGAHRLRNQLVHDVAFELRPHQAKQAIRDFKHALQVLNVLS